MKAKVNKSMCIGCGACVAACPHGAITIEADGKATVNPNRCVGCGECAHTCPMSAINVK